LVVDRGELGAVDDDSPRYGGKQARVAAPCALGPRTRPNGRPSP